VKTANFAAVIQTSYVSWKTILVCITRVEFGILLFSGTLDYVLNQ